jgi:F-type H+-transporting ATPase subunit epsilon
MADTIRLEVVTPSGVVLSKDVSEVTAPGISGEIGVLPGHRPLLAALRTGAVSYKIGGEEAKAVVGYGFAEVVEDRALLLTEKFARKEDVDVVAVRARLKEVGEELSAWNKDIDDPERAKLIEEEQWLGAELELVGDPPQPTVRENTRFVEKAEREKGILYDEAADPNTAGENHAKPSED